MPLSGNLNTFGRRTSLLFDAEVFVSLGRGVLLHVTVTVAICERAARMMEGSGVEASSWSVAASARDV